MSVGESRSFQRVATRMLRTSAIVVSSTSDIVSVQSAGFDPGDSAAAGDGVLGEVIDLLVEGRCACLTSARSPDRSMTSSIGGMSIRTDPLLPVYAENTYQASTSNVFWLYFLSSLNDSMGDVL